MKILLTGGAGYIGGIAAKELQKQGYEVVVLDNLENGHKYAVSSRLVICDLKDKDSLFAKLGDERFDAVMHFAAYALTPESMRDPYKYFHNNIDGGLNLLEYMQSKKIKKIIFSSSCSIFGQPTVLPIGEEAPKNPESVYGESKLVFEKILHWYRVVHEIEYISLRYFNACGALLDGSLGEDHTPETHIIPLAINAALENKQFYLYGNDYDTPDKTCIRDYIHVVDLAQAHILALEYLSRHEESGHYNLGSGKGYSNREIIDTVKRITGVDFPVVEKERRFGDPPGLYADAAKAHKVLGFLPKYSDLDTIISSALLWHKKLREQ